MLRFARPAALVRVLLPLGIVLVGLQPAAASAATSQRQAEQKAIAALDVRSSDDPVVVFRAPSRVPRDTPIHQAGVSSPRVATATPSPGRAQRRAGVTVSDAPVVLRTGDEAAWLFYEDRGPYQAYQHPGRVVLVGATSGRVRVSQSLRWPPLIDGELPPFLASYEAYREPRYRAFVRGWTLKASATSRATTSLLKPAAPDYVGSLRAAPPVTPARRQAADQLAAERSCAIRISDTLGSFYDAGPVDRTRQSLGTFFNQLARLNPQFFTARYRYREGRTPAQFVAHAIQRNGCKDVLLYLGGGGYAGADPAVNVGTRGLGDGRIEQQVVTLDAVRSILRAHRGVTFKLLIDAPYSGGFQPTLQRESNLLFLATSSGADEAAFTALADVVDGRDRPVANDYNRRGFLEFTNRMLTGLNCFLSRPEEVAAATRAKAEGRTRSFLAWMLGRSFSVCAVGSLGDRVAGGPTPTIYVAGGVPGAPGPTDPAPINRVPVATPGAVTTAEDTPVAITLAGTDADGDALTYAVTSGPSHGRIAVAPGNGAQLVYTPDPDAHGSDSLSFAVSDGKLLSAPATVSIVVTEVDDAPVVTLGGGTTTFTEPGPAIAVDPALDVTDVDDPTLVGASVRITEGFAAGDDELVFADQAGISGDFDAATGVLTLTGDAPIAAYRAALRSVEFDNDSLNPTADARQVVFVVDDGERTSAPVTRPVGFETVNDAPVLADGGTTAAYTEDDQTGVLVAPAVTVADIDNSTLASATLTISGGHVPSEDELLFEDEDGISGSYDAPTGVLTLTGVATKAAYQAALRSVRYRNLNVDAPSTANRTVSLQVDDGSTANATSAPITTDVTVAPVNDAPTATAGGGTPSYSEGASPVVVDPGLDVADVDDADVESATVTIGTGFDSADDRLELPVTPVGLTASFSPVTGALTISGTATKAVYQAALRTVTYVNDDGDDPSTDARSISFVVDDGDLDSSAATTTLSVVAVNDAPTLSGGGNTVTFEEDDTLGVIVNSGITVSDVDNADQAGATVSLTTGFDADDDELLFEDQAGISGSYDAATGVLTLTGSATKAEYETALRSVRYRNANTGDPSTTSRVVQFRIDDGSATSNVSTAVVSTVDIDPSNDAPTTVAGGGSPTFAEGDAPVLVDPAIVVVDVDDADLTGASVTIGSGFVSTEDELDFDDTATITGTYDAATGVLTLTGTDTVAAYQDALRSVTYVNLNGDDPSPTSREVAFTVSDAGLPSVPALTTVAITPVNDAPTLGGTPAAVTYTEDDATGVVLDSALTVADVDSTDLAGATVALTTGFAAAEDELLFVDESGITGSYDAATGILTLTGSATKAEYQAALRTVRYRNGSDDPSTTTRLFAVQVWDGAAENALSDVRIGTVAVEAVNDAPTVTAGSTSASFTEDSLTGVVVDSTVTVADVDSPTISSATVSISGNWNAGEDVLALPTTPGLSGVYNPGSGVLTITGVATPAAYAAALRTVTYANTNTDDPSTVDRGIDFAVDDGAATNSASNTAAATVAVVPVNDAPTVSLLTGSNAFVEATSADPGSGPVAVDGSALVADVDDNDLEGATLVISANLSADDRLLFTDQNGITGDYTVATGTLELTGTATVAEYQAAIRSVRFETLGDTPSTDVRTVTVQVTDGDDSSTTETRDVSVTASDDLPTVTLSASTPDFTEAGSPVVVDDGLTVADVDSDDLQSATVCICSGRVNAEDELLYTTTNGITATAYDAATGTLTLSGPGSKADFEAALRTVEYRNTDLVTPDPGARGIDFVVNDGSSDSAAATKTVTITSLNDPPVLGGGGNTVNYVEDDAATVVNGALTAA
ncbi:MAG: tandem-95 repeat protein, partial [Patulibacter sp.]